jgi:cytochrome c556
MKRVVLAASLFAGLALLYVPVPASADDDDVVDYRRHLMSALNEHAAALGQILSGAAPDADAAVHIEAIALTASVALKAFEAKVPGGQSRPEVWSNWADFSKRMNEFASETADVAKLAQTKGNDAALASAAGALTCKGCHDVYRQEKK